MRVAILHMGFFYSGGGERTVLSEAIKLTERGMDVEVFAPTRSSGCYPELMKKIEFHEDAGFLPQRMPLRNAWGMLLDSLTSWANVKRFSGFDAILAHGQPSNWLAYQAWRRFRVPYVSYLHQANRFLYPRGIDKESGWGVSGDMRALEMIVRGAFFVKSIDRLTVRSSAHTLVNSEWIKGKVQDCYGVDPEVCYPGVDGDEFKPSIEHGNYILSTNRHYPQKRIDLVIRLLKDLGEGATAVITGAWTKHTASLRRLALDLDVQKRVKFTGSVSGSELVKLYQRAAVYSYPSPEEDFGLGPVEAGACGVPSVVWDNAGPREVVDDSVTGFRVAPGDSFGFAEAHRKLLDDPRLRSKMGRAARRKVEQKFTWDRHTDIIEKHLSEACI